MTSAERLTEDCHHRLALVRLLLERGRDAVREPPPMAALGLLPLHDAVEMFLRVAGEAVGAKLTEHTGFMKYFELIDEQLPTGPSLAERGTMDRLNRARVGLKHAGLLPDHGQLTAHREAVDRFFAFNVPLIFGRELAAISLVHLVRDADVRRELEEAERHLAAGEVKEAVTAAATAAERALIRAGVVGRGAIPAGPVRGVSPAVIEMLADFAAVLRIRSAGIDSAAYGAFQAITPSVAFSTAGKPQIRWRAGLKLDRDQAEAAVEFAIDVALRTQDALAAVEHTYTRFSLVRAGNAWVLRQDVPPASDPPRS